MAFAAKLFLYVFVLMLPVTGFAQNLKTPETSARVRYVLPGKSHQFISKYQGEWNADISLWLYPGGTPEKCSGTAINTMILGGRYLQTVQKCSMPAITFEGINTLGQHANSEKFTLTIINNLGTGTLTLTGFWMLPEKTIELFGDIPTPENTDVLHVRLLINFIDINHYLIQQFDKRAGYDEYKSAEYNFTRTSPLK